MRHIEDIDYYRRRKRKGGLKRWIIGFLLLLVIFSLLVLMGIFRQDSAGSKSALSEEEMQALIPKGRELALAGDCFGCHTREGGERGAGGVAIKMEPLGTIYSTNITPDREFGIGNYTREDFHRALKDGIGKERGNLYPAMPYVFTHITTDEDIDALYAYLMSLPPLAIPNAQNSGIFAWPIRPFLNFWTLLNFPDRHLPHNSDRSDAWNRGAYLVEGLAHCGACHSPRNFMMGVDFKEALSGCFEDGLVIPDITAETLAKRGYSLEDLSEYLATGIAPEGVSFAGMETVTHFSTSEMNREDINAMATYLLTDSAGKLLTPKRSPIVINQIKGEMKRADLIAGRDHYLAACATCHGVEGHGIPHVAPALAGNAIVMMQDPQTLIALVLKGIATTSYSNGERMYAMPGFEGALTPKEIADLLNWVKAEWGNIDQPIGTIREDRVKEDRIEEESVSAEEATLPADTPL